MTKNQNNTISELIKNIDNCSLKQIMHLSNALGAKEEIIGGVTLNNTNESPGSVTSRAIYTLDRKERMINITDRDDTETTCTQ